MRFIFLQLAFSGLLLITFTTASAQTQKATADYSRAQSELTTLRQKADLLIENTEWKQKIANMSYERLQKLERIYQFPLGKTLKSNPQITESELKAIVKSWYEASPDLRAKILVSL